MTEKELELTAAICNAANALAENARAEERLDRDEKLKQMMAERDGERAEREKCQDALVIKDRAMGTLFSRMDAAGVGYSDLIS